MATIIVRVGEVLRPANLDPNVRDNKLTADS